MFGRKPHRSDMTGCALCGGAPRTAACVRALASGRRRAEKT